MEKYVYFNHCISQLFISDGQLLEEITYTVLVVVYAKVKGNIGYYVKVYELKSIFLLMIFYPMGAGSYPNANVWNHFYNILKNVHYS